jgi:RNA polymerase sigma factor (sigma-70 family)
MIGAKSYKSFPVSEAQENRLRPETATQSFPTTHWSLLTTAGEIQSPGSAEALAELCGSYWYPVYCYVRRTGSDPHTAQDLTQEFFARLIKQNFISGAAQEKGRFRSFLLIALKRFLVNEWERTQAQKRGGGQAIVSLDATEAEERYQLEPIDEMTAERIYERRWAMALLDEVMNRLGAEQAEAGKTELFEALKIFLYRDKSDMSQEQIGERFGLSESAIKSAVHRLRQRYRELLYETVGKTVANRIDVEDELRHLFHVLSG